MIQPERIEIFRTSDSLLDGEIVYWMQSAQRTVDNHALAYAIDTANRYKRALKVIFILVPDYPSANTRHYQFMLDGLCELDKTLMEMGIAFEMYFGDPVKVFQHEMQDMTYLVMDDAPMPYLKSLKKRILENLTCPAAQVHTNTLIPVHQAYPKSAYGAYVLRPAIHKKMSYFLQSIEKRDLKVKIKRELLSHDFFDVKWLKIQGFLTCETLSDSERFKGGTSRAISAMSEFLRYGILNYDNKSNDPALDVTSHMSPYLHFGQVSPLTLLNMMWESGNQSDKYIEQLIVRRELSFNLMYYEPDALKSVYRSLPDWAIQTLHNHENDKREVEYNVQTFENALTHDLLWNAAQTQLIREGVIHNYMRMYWGKKVIEWCESPERAFEILIYLNDKYALDGRDPNGYAGILWCFGKHDRPWRERPVFGKIRYMNDKGLRRKFDMTNYLSKYR